MSLERILMKLYTFNDKSSGAVYCLNKEKSETCVIAKMAVDFEQMFEACS